MPRDRKPVPGCCHITYLYALVDPVTDVIGYVGKSDKPAERYRTHLQEGRRFRFDARTMWINDLFRLGRKPSLRILKAVPYETWRHAEEKMIRLQAMHAALRNWQVANPHFVELPGRVFGPVVMKATF